MSNAPLHVLREHVCNKDCWCRPTLHDEDPGYDPVYVHHSMDRREDYEQGRKVH